MRLYEKRINSCTECPALMNEFSLDFIHCQEFGHTIKTSDLRNKKSLPEAVKRLHSKCKLPHYTGLLTIEKMQIFRAGYAAGAKECGGEAAVGIREIIEEENGK